MSFQCEISDDTAHMQIIGELSIYTASELAAQLLPKLGATAHLTLDLAEVTEMDGAGLQLLLLVKREAFKAGTTFNLTGQSKAVLETLELCNLNTAV